MKLKLNLLTGKVNTEADIPSNLSREEFWKLYLKALNIRQAILTDREIDFVAAFIISDDPKFLQEHLKMSAPNYYSMIKRLVNKGMLIEKEDGLKVHPNLLKLDKYLNEDDAEVSIIFAIKLS